MKVGRGPRVLLCDDLEEFAASINVLYNGELSTKMDKVRRTVWNQILLTVGISMLLSMVLYVLDYDNYFIPTAISLGILVWCIPILRSVRKIEYTQVLEILENDKTVELDMSGIDTDQPS